MAYMQWHIVSRDQYSAGTPVDSDLYFITGENVIYRGNELYTKAVEFVSVWPANPAPNRLYVDSTTLEGKMHDGTSWKQVIKPLADTVTADGTNPVSGKAVADYVSAEIGKITGSGVVLTGASYDPVEHMLTFSKGDDSSVNIVLTGIGTSLNYNQNTGVLSMLGADGEVVGDTVNLALEKFVKSGEYDPIEKKIILYFDDAKSDKVEIPVGDLVDTYTVESTDTVTLTMIANKITAAVNISAEEGNSLVAKADGLYVPTVDVSGKMDKVADAVSGNILITDENGQAIDSGKSFDDIAANTQIFIGDSIENATAGSTPAKGDFCIVKKQIGTSNKYEHTAYIYNGTEWQALDGNYNAENVYFPEDLITTAAIGNITLTNGQATISAAGKNLKDVWNTIFVKEKNPSITQPSVSVSAPQNKAYEVGTTVTPTYTATLNAGSYQYGPATGITATNWSVTDSASHSADTNSGSFDAFVVEDSTNYIITATAEYGDGAIPVTNIGSEYAGGQIKAGSKSASSAAVTGFRCGFYGTLTNKNSLTSDSIRGLTAVNSPSAGKVLNLSVPVGAMRVVIAYPATIRDLTSVLDTNGMNAEIKSAFTMSQIDVEGANNYTAIPYKVYVMDFATANDTANTLKVTL